MSCLAAVPVKLSGSVDPTFQDQHCAFSSLTQLEHVQIIKHFVVDTSCTAVVLLSQFSGCVYLMPVQGSYPSIRGLNLGIFQMTIWITHC